MRTISVPAPSSGWADGLLTAAEVARLLRERGVEARADGRGIEVRAPEEWAMVRHSWGLDGISRAAAGIPGPPATAPSTALRADSRTWTDVPDGAVAARVPFETGRSRWLASRWNEVAAQALAAFGAALTLRVLDGREFLQVTVDTPTVDEFSGARAPGRLVAALRAAIGDLRAPGEGPEPAGPVWGRGVVRPSLVVDELWAGWRESWGPEPDRSRLVQVVRAWGGLLSEQGRLELPWWRGHLDADACVADLVRCLGAGASSAASLPAFRRRTPPRRPSVHRVGPALAAIGLFEVRTPCLREAGHTIAGRSRGSGAPRVARVRTPGVDLRSDLVTGMLAPEHRLPVPQQGKEHPRGSFEIGVVFPATDGAALPAERQHLGIVVRLGGRPGRSVSAALALVRQAVDVAADALHVEVRAGDVPRGSLEAPLLGAGDRVVGRLRLHPPAGRRQPPRYGAVSAELDIEAALRSDRVPGRGRSARGGRLFGSTAIDRSFVLGTDVTAGQVLAVARSVRGIRDARTVEDFVGAPYGPGRRSLTVRLYLDVGRRPSERPEVSEVVEELERELGARPREKWRLDQKETSNSHSPKDL
ncbi:hypothetical protein [Streptomyces sp. NPDC050388]|uniref:hypothetical protein n=1 Tax=Streptomyces sp. NPDC050388 TaxID=3155781 RepID=UPI003437A756